MSSGWALGPLHIFFKWYNGVAFGLKSDEVYELVGFEKKEEGDKIDVDERTAWVLILPLVEIYFTL